MVEFRTKAPGSNPQGEKQESSSPVDEIFERAIQNLEKNPQAKVQLAQVAQQQFGIPPQLLATVLGDMPEPEPQEQQPETVEAKQVETTTQPNAMNKDTQNGPEPDLSQEKIASIIGDVMEFHPKGGDLTLSELKTFVEENPDLIDNVLDMGL